MSIIFRLLFAASILLTTAAFAAADDWRVVKATTQAKYTVDRANWLDLHAGEVVPNRAWVSTGPRGRLQLARGVESITFQPNTLASITTSGVMARKTEVVQQVGSLDLEIEKRSQPHTTVQTPYLAAVVKGTVFHVTVGKTKASVSVDRGLVQVTSFASGQLSNVGPRQSATVDNKAGMTVRGELSKPKITSVAPSVAKVPAVATTKLAGAVEASAAKNTPSAAAKNTNSSKAGVGGNGKGSGSSSNGTGGNGNSGSNGNGNSGKGDSNSGGKSNSSSSGHGNSGKGDNDSGGSSSGHGNNGKGDNNSGGKGKDSGGSGKGKDK
ncbi:hypothetical protein ATY76_29955 [Rhizobium sp. R339]|uniref:FecR domain-containing protein n=1 Tax=Rhizobium sp. R339 TaxID=1764273 RepID=UPI000B5296E0|nr:FecR domain-containing protein [Rhizobium sp. R339]OWV73572.1 hypothetical protein ATY76_29955 [Rhizobium sp. R339]